MIAESKLQEYLVTYKQEFAERIWPDEKYKWEAVKCFQDNWNIDAEDFPAMLKASLSQTGNLLQNTKLPKDMIEKLADAVPTEVRQMFSELFDESGDLYGRIDAFKNKALELCSKHYPGKSHYQDENTISIYLWLKYPDKYYIYKQTLAKMDAEALQADYQFKKGNYAQNIKDFMLMYDEMNAVVSQDEELVKLLKENLTEETCWPDTKFKTLTIDVSYYIWGKAKEKSEMKKAFYKYLGEDDSLSGYSRSYKLVLFKYLFELMDEDGVADFAAITEKFKHYYLDRKNKGLLPDKDADPVIANIETSSNDDVYKLILKNPYNYIQAKGYITKTVVNDSEKLCLNEDLVAVLDEHDLEKIKRIIDDKLKLYFKKIDCNDDKNMTTNAVKQSDLCVDSIPALGNLSGEKHYWFLNANPKLWRMSSMSVGEVQDYTLYNDNNNKRRIFQNFLDAKAGDMVIGYESSPVKQVVALMRVSAEQDGKKLCFEKLEGLSSPIDFAALKASPELKEMEYLSSPQGSLFKLTEAEYDVILDMIRDENPATTVRVNEKYGKTNFLNDVYMAEERYNRLVAVLKKKKNIILQGAPGVGKTFAAKRLAYSIMGEKNDDRIGFVQFHQNYSYEDFVMGYKPDGEGFELRLGIFYSFCNKAANHPDKDYFFIIDEINRGNMSKIFGELLMLIEADYRGKEITLAYNGLGFSVPKNIHIIGMMNTADRSLAMIDYALRRRFSFFNMEPGFDSEGFKKYQSGLANDKFNILIDNIKELNLEITKDNSLGSGFCIGHSYFCNVKECTNEWMKDVVDFDIIPMLSEYWFDDIDRLQNWESRLQGIVK